MEHLDEKFVKELVWNYIGEYLEKIENIPFMLKDIGYVEDLDKLVDIINFVENFNSEIEIENMKERNR